MTGSAGTGWDSDGRYVSLFEMILKTGRGVQGGRGGGVGTFLPDLAQNVAFSAIF